MWFTAFAGDIIYFTNFFFLDKKALAVQLVDVSFFAKNSI